MEGKKKRKWVPQSSPEFGVVPNFADREPNDVQIFLSLVSRIFRIR